MKVKLDEGAYMPERAHDTDAGMDLRSREEAFVPAKGSHVFDTGVHIQLPMCYFYDENGMLKLTPTVGFLKSKSGLNVKHGITSEGVVDVGYTGSIRVKLYNNEDTNYHVNVGDKISQLVILPALQYPLELVDKLDETERGDNGFGSTGR